MVKGKNKHVIIVDSPDPQVFEEAIFVLKEEYVRSRSAEQVMREARRAAEEYLRRNGAPRRKKGRVWGAVLTAAGVLAAGIAWLAMRLTGVSP